MVSSGYYLDHTPHRNQQQGGLCPIDLVSCCLSGLVLYIFSVLWHTMALRRHCHGTPNP